MRETGVFMNTKSVSRSKRPLEQEVRLQHWKLQPTLEGWRWSYSGYGSSDGDSDESDQYDDNRKFKR